MPGLMIAGIKYDNAWTGMVELFELDSSTGYTTFKITTPTSLALADGRNFIYDMGRPLGTPWVLAAIKVLNTDSHKIEVHTLPRTCNYQCFGVQAVTPIDLIDGRNFAFLFGEYGDLICVKVRNTESGWVEVHVISFDNAGYQTFSTQVATSIDLTEAAHFNFLVTNSNNIVGVKLSNTKSNFVELHFLSDDYKSISRKVETSLSTVNATNFSVYMFESFLFGGKSFQNLVGVSGRAPASGHVEIVKLAAPWNGPLEIFKSAVMATDRPNFQFALMR